MDLVSLSETQYLGNSLKSYLLALGIAITLLVILFVGEKLIVRRLKILAEKTEAIFDDFVIKLIEKPFWPSHFHLKTYP